MGQRLHTRAALLLVAGLWVGPAWAADPWTTEDKYWQAAYTVLHVADWAQSRHIADNPDRFRDGNRFLRYASTSDVNRYFAATLAGHYAVVHLLPQRWRQPFQFVTVAIEFGAVAHNYRVGVRMEF